MPDFTLPILGFGDRVRVEWKDGTPCGILGNIEEALARRQAEDAEEAQKQILRSQGITVLADFRKGT